MPAKISARRCMRPAACSSRSSNDCAPRLMRLNPAASHACAFSGVMVSGSASRVISGRAAAASVSRVDRTHAPQIANPKFARSESRIRASAEGSSKLGVPPPKYTVSIVAPRSGKSADAASSRFPGTPQRRTAGIYRARPRPYENCNRCTWSGRKAPECKRRGSFGLGDHVKFVGDGFFMDLGSSIASQWKPTPSTLTSL